VCELPPEGEFELLPPPHPPQPPSPLPSDWACATDILIIERGTETAKTMVKIKPMMIASPFTPENVVFIIYSVSTN
jgi:hypothetical protein